MDDALNAVAVDWDMLRSLLMPRPKLEKLPNREPLKRKRPQDMGKAQDTGKPGIGARRKPTDECFQWIAGKCAKENCRFLHHCESCQASDH